MKICLEYAALLDPFADGELTAEELLRVQNHLENCPACRAYVDDALAIRAAFPDAEDTPVPEGFAESVSAAIRAGAAPQRRTASPWAKTVLPLAACCAIVILLAGSPTLSRSAGGDNSASLAAVPYAMDAPETAADSGEPMDDSEAPPEEESSPVTTAEYGSQEDALPEAALDDAEDLDGSQAGGPKLRSIPPVADAPAASPAPALQSHDGTSGEDAAGGQKLSDDPTAGIDPQSAAKEEEAWVQHGNVVFAAVVFLSQDEAGDALTDCEGRPYSDFNHPEDGVLGTGYALEPADFERILEELGQPFQNPLDQFRTTELRCIVVTED